MTYTPQEWKNLPDTTTPIKADRLLHMEGGISGINTLLEMLGLDKDTFSTSKTYSVGDYVVKDHVLYKCIKAVTTAGTWNSSNWEKSYFFQAN